MNWFSSQFYLIVTHRQQEVDRLREERNAVANKMKGKLEPSERQKLIEEGMFEQCHRFIISTYSATFLSHLYILQSGKNLKEGLVTLEEDLVKLTDELQQEAQCIPNMTHPDVPVGGEDCSIIRKTVSQLLCIIIFQS